MKKYLMALILGLAVLLTVSSCEDNMNEITKQETEKSKPTKPN